MTAFPYRFAKKSKYGAKRVEFAGRSFASQLERDTFALLKLMEEQGQIKDLRCQVQVLLSDAGIIYKPDFAFWDCEKAQAAWAEAKGFETSDWKIKLKLWRHYGPGPLWIFRAHRGGPQITEIVIPKERT